jgi:hypothetical protein
MEAFPIDSRQLEPFVCAGTEACFVELRRILLRDDHDAKSESVAAEFLCCCQRPSAGAAIEQEDHVDVGELVIAQPYIRAVFSKGGSKRLRHAL